jgi:hypothetical protein
MIPKEKSIELVNRYYQLFSVDLENTIDTREAKECAIMCVYEILKANPHSNPFNTDIYSTMGYWHRVIQEIEKL